MSKLLFCVLAATLALLPASSVRGQIPPENLRCLNCHGQRTIATASPEERAAMVATPPSELRPDPQNLYFDRELFARSVHAQIRCIDCHPGSSTLPHPAELPAPTCETCHPAQTELYSRSVHAVELAGGESPMPHCWTCHGGHDILPPTDRKARTYPLNILAVCGGCHRQHGVPRLRSPTDLQDSGEVLVEDYLDSVHGQAVRAAGLIVAATCPDCHRAHEVQPSHHPDSSVNRAHVADTCGRCHVGVAEQYADSIHSRLKHDDEHRERVPVCTNCHSAHRITRAETDTFARDIVEECGTCHVDLYATYRESYHGQVNRLGYRRAARCSDCHGAHNIQEIGQAESASASARKVAMCARCHEGANENFAQFIAHADFRDRQRYPVLFYVWMYFIVIITATFSFFGLHTILWWVRALIERLRSGPPKHNPNGRTFVRFRPIHRFTHALVIISFMGLTLTGIPLKFSDQPWAVSLANALGGGNVAGILHRVFAVVMLVYVCIHGWVVVRWVRAQRKAGRKGWLFGPESMLPRWKDARDLLGMFRWFVGRGPKPRFDRWTYWEKFDYWADAVGTVIIGGSGLMLAFPIVTSWLLPGWMFNVAMIVHGYEALLAIGFIFTMHFFNAHLRLEKFPGDPVIFSGQISEHEMREERPLEYERLQQQGGLEELVVAPKPRGFSTAVKAVGGVLLLTGITLIVLIIWAGLTGLMR
jgi:cytochrome b subunit of formate dehydrogenase